MTTLKYKFVKTESALTAMVNESIKTAKTMRDSVQITSVAIIKYALTTGDYRAFNTLVDGLGDGVNTPALVEYIVTMTGLKIDEKAGCFTGKVDKEYITSKFQDAKSTMWYSFKKPTPWKGFDLTAVLAKAYKSAIEAQEKVEDDDGLAPLVNIDKATLEALALLVNK